MAEIADQIFWWLDGNRLSQWGALGDPTDEKAEVTFTSNEEKRIVGLPGKRSGEENFTFQDYDAPTMVILESYDTNTEIAFAKTLNPAAGQPCIMYRGRLLSNASPLEGNVLALRRMRFKVSSGSGKCYGKNLYPYTTDITAPANGSTITIGALTATQSLLMMQHVEAVTGAGNFDAKIVSDPAGVPADAKVFTQVAHTDVAALANHNSGQFALFNGAKAATDYRYEITAVSGGTWNVQVCAVVIDEL